MGFPTADVPFDTAEVDALNQVLILCGLTLVSGVDALDPASDASHALALLRQVFRNETSRGWYCFNKQELLEVEPSESGQYLVDQTARKVAISPSYRAFNPCVPRVRLSSTVTDGKRELLDAVTLESLSANEATIKVDLVHDKGGWAECPSELASFIIAKTATLFGPMVANPVPRDVLEEARASLEQLEADSEQRYNVFEDDPWVARTWMR